MRGDCISWATNRYKDIGMKDAALKDMSSHFLVMAFLPFNAGEIRQRIKHWGDTQGYMTQCIVCILLHFRSRRTIYTSTRSSQRQKDPSSPRNKFNDQYFNNLVLK